MTRWKAFKIMQWKQIHCTINVTKGAKDKRLCILSVKEIVCFMLFHYSSGQAIVNSVTTKQTILLRWRFIIVSIIFVDIQLCDQ